MFKTVLVPLDGSAVAERAIDLALPIVLASGANLHLAAVRCHVPKVGEASDDVERHYLEHSADIVGHRLGKPVTPVMLVDVVAGRPMGEPPRRAVADVLEDYVREYPVDLTIMTTHGRGGLSRLSMGSVADAFMRYSPAPVLIFKPVTKRTEITHLLVLLDGTDEAELIVPAALDLARSLGARCSLLRIIPPGTSPYDAVRELTETARRFIDAGIAVDVDVRMSENVAAAVLVYAASCGADAFALTTRTRNPLQRMFLGSVADALMRKAGKPVLICNPFTISATKSADTMQAVTHEQ